MEVDAEDTAKEGIVMKLYRKRVNQRSVSADLSVRGGKTGSSAEFSGIPINNRDLPILLLFV